ncbi:nucleotidyl transferase AbiEii/AbiGii toxin family protein [Thauera sinica]|uniref:Nucleotidyl transferase AbiEii/AbiGii toxin family protein n=1 Tax=Thauera sinica TaxID=2665146 RepID=A0ABW1AQ68_9RHOO|nr:nucleotidyl transferase AbiEii/AbiGii toxin family protein [Thauera sp. K11]
MKAPKNMGVSVRDRLAQRARERRENTQRLMTRYVIERVLYRLSVSPHRDRFVLKGAMLFSLWADVPYRATSDLDLLGFGENAPDAIAAVFSEILAIPLEDDGIVFRPETLRAAAARAEDEYAGVRLDFVAELAGARLPMHIDIGYGDAITPEPVQKYRPASRNSFCHPRAHRPKPCHSTPAGCLAAPGPTSEVEPSVPWGSPTERTPRHARGNS